MKDTAMQADYILLQDSKFTITYPGSAHTIKFDTSPLICRSCPFVLFFMLDTVGDPDGLRIRININNNTVGEYKHSRSRFSTVHEIVQNIPLLPTDNNIEFSPLSGSGKVEYSDVVLLVKVGT